MPNKIYESEKISGKVVDTEESVEIIIAWEYAVEPLLFPTGERKNVYTPKRGNHNDLPPEFRTAIFFSLRKTKRPRHRASIFSGVASGLAS